MVAARNIAGQVFGNLTALECLGSDRHGKRVWRFACSCGSTHEAVASLVIRGTTTSCGCVADKSRADRAKRAGIARGEQLRKHGDAARTPEYAVWKTMRQRCNNPRCADFRAYGGRGIKVCQRWGDYAAFIADMGKRPSDAHSIDRIDTDGNYEPGNCRWATDHEQAANRRPRGTGECATTTEH